MNQERLRKLAGLNEAERTEEIFNKVSELPGDLPKILRKIGAASRFFRGEDSGLSYRILLKPGFVDMPVFRAASKERTFMGIRAKKNSVVLVFDKSLILAP